MKTFILKTCILLTLALPAAGCSKKYHRYAIIEKKSFGEEQLSRPVERPPKMMLGKKETEQFCEGQILFNKNAEKIAEASVPALVSQSCPGSDYLLNAKITYLWWTTLAYTRACVKVESFCPQRPR